MADSPRPNQHLLALVTFAALVPLVYFIPEWLATFLPNNKLLNVIIAVAIIVPIISYIVMPLFIRYYTRIKRAP